jgi:hypothetical protein
VREAVHLLPDATVHAIGTNEDVSLIAGPILRHDTHSSVILLKTHKPLANQDLFLLLQLLV